MKLSLSDFAKLMQESKGDNPASAAERRLGWDDGSM
jgi:hypothetical protein